MNTIVLLPDFDTPQEEVRRLAAESYASGEELNIEIPIAGRLYHTDTEFLVGQFLYAAYIGQTIAGACSTFECETPSSIDAHESVELYVVPKDVDDFVARFWESIIGFMSEELLEQAGHDEMSAAEARSEGWEYLEKPELAPATSDLVEHAQQMLDAIGDDEDDDEDGDENE